MSIASDVTRISAALDEVESGKNAIAEAITAKGVDTLPGAGFDTLATKIGLIEGGGGGIDYSDPLAYLGANPKVVFQATEHFTLADLSFDTSANYATPATLRAGGATIADFTNTKSEKDYAVWIKTTSRLLYNGIPEKVYAHGYVNDAVYMVFTSYNANMSSGRENNMLLVSSGTNVLSTGKTRVRNAGLYITATVPAVAPNANPTSITVKTMGINFASHAWVLDPTSVPLIDTTRSSIDIEYRIIETDRYNMPNGFLVSHLKEFGVTE